jgi:hypothetical protein
MRQISGGSWRLQSSLTGLRSIGAVAAFLLFFFPYSCARTTAANIPSTPDQPHLVKPDQYNVEACEEYFNRLKPGLQAARGDRLKPGLQATRGDDDYQEKYTIHALCEARPANLSLLVDGAAADDIAAGDTATGPITLSAEFVKAVVESNEFDAPGYDRIAIDGAVIKGDLNLAKITINNALVFENVRFLGNVDFSYSSTAHNLDVSGTLPNSKVLCLKGLQTNASVFIYNLFYQLDNQPVQKSFCTDTIGSPLHRPPRGSYRRPT